MPQPDWEEMERRVARLERLMGVEGTAPTPIASPAVVAAPALPVNPSAVLPMLGRALLGLAGAYLLRAVSERSAALSAPGVAAGIAYAIVWLIWAARTPSPHSLEAVIRSLTAVLVLCPLLWEATTSFHVLTAWTAASVLIAFNVLGLAVSWRKNLLAVATIVILSGLATAAGLLVATRDVVPFVVVFLAIAVAVEVSSCLGHFLSERWLVALAADLSVLLATWLVTREHGVPETYAAIPFGWLLGAQMALLGIYLASVVVRTLLRGLTFTWFETAQCVAAFLIAVGGGLRISGNPQWIGVFLLAGGAACYLVSFRFMARVPEQARNFHIYATFGILLLLAGSRILLPGAAASAMWCVLALACNWAGSLFGSWLLRAHGGIYLLLGLAGSGALSKAAGFILGSAHWTGDSPGALWAGLLAAALAYLLLVRGRGVREPAGAQAFRLAVAGTLAWLLAGTLAGAATSGYHAAFGAEGHPYCATMRTAVLSGIALALAWAGSRWKVAELSRLAIPAMIVGGYRLVVVDLAQDYKPALFWSLAVYGGVLVLLPRLARGRSEAAAT
jgi:hypothetical protein